MLDDVSEIIKNLLKKENKKRRKFKKSVLFDDKFAKEGFTYVVQKKKKPKVAFQSGQNRKLLHERKGFDRIDCHIITRPVHDLAPGVHQNEDKFPSAFSKTRDQIVSKSGVSGIAFKAKRFPPPPLSDSPPATKYKTKDVFQVDKVNKYPFNSTTTRETDVTTDIPGVCTYETMANEKDHSIPFEHSFGGRTKLKPVIKVKCTPDNRDVCRYCNEKPVGDYWISTEKEGHAVCAECYGIKKLYKEKLFDSNKPKYQKIRDCAFVHSHEGTTAALPLMSEKDFLKQTIRECYFSTYMPTHVIKKKKPPTYHRKTLSKNAEVSGGDPDFLFKKMSKFINNLYSESEAEYLKKRDISDQRVRQILTPLSLVPNETTLMNHLMKEQEPHMLRDFPKRGARRKKKIDIDQICEKWEWKYQEKEFKWDDILKEQKIPEEVKAKLRKGGQLPILPPAQTDKSQTGGQEKHQIEDYLWLMFKNKVYQENKEKDIPIISEPLQYAISLIPTELKEYQIEKGDIITPVKSTVMPKTEVIKVEEEPEVRSIREWSSDLELLQDPDIPPMPRPLRPGDEPMDKSALDPDIASIFDDSDHHTTDDERSLSALTVGSQHGYKQLKL